MIPDGRLLGAQALGEDNVDKPISALAMAIQMEAFYHSAVNFATLGYGDVVMSAKHKLLGPLEAINVALMIGVSTAALISTFQQVIQTTARTRHR